MQILSTLPVLNTQYFGRRHSRSFSIHSCREVPSGECSDVLSVWQTFALTERSDPPSIADGQHRLNITRAVRQAMPKRLKIAVPTSERLFKYKAREMFYPFAIEYSGVKLYNFDLAQDTSSQQ
jgi:hypothetical protein